LKLVSAGATREDDSVRFSRVSNLPDRAMASQ